MRALAALQRGGLDLRSAILAWPSSAPPRLRPLISRIARRVALGEEPSEALRHLGDDIEPLPRVLPAYAREGGDVADLLERHAAMLDRRRAAARRALAGASGARLSGRLVAALPVLFVPFTPRSADPAGLSFLIVGVSLAAAGLWWIERLLPSPDELSDPSVDAAELIAALLAAGASMDSALAAAAAAEAEAFGRAPRRVRLGVAWADALAREPGLAWIGETIRRARRWGVPAADALAAEAARRRAAAEDAFEARARRGAVFMALPLACCVLPSYLLLGVLPLLR